MVAIDGTRMAGNASRQSTRDFAQMAREILSLSSAAITAFPLDHPSTVSSRAADGYIAEMMRNPTGARLTSDAALLLIGVGLVVCHRLERLRRLQRLDNRISSYGTGAIVRADRGRATEGAPA